MRVSQEVMLRSKEGNPVHSTFEPFVFQGLAKVIEQMAMRNVCN